MNFQLYELYNYRFPGSAAVAQLAVNQLVVGSNPTPGAKLYVASLLPRRFAPRQAGCIVFAKIFWVQSPPFAKAKRGSSQSFLENLFSQKDFPAKR